MSGYQIHLNTHDTDLAFGVTGAVVLEHLARALREVGGDDVDGFAVSHLDGESALDRVVLAFRLDRESEV